MNDPSIEAAIAEAALHALIVQRCQRAYVHELRNGLQGIYASVDVLTRIAEGKSPATIPIDKVKEIARRALQSHDQGINQAVRQMALQKEEASAVDVTAVIRELCAFIGNDAAAHDVTLSVTAAEANPISVDPSRFRSTLLGAIVCSIDSLRGGQLIIGLSSADGQVAIELVMLASDEALDRPPESLPGFWILDSAKVSGSWLWAAMQGVVQRDGGQLETSVVDPSQYASADGARYSSGRAVRFRYRAAIPSSFDKRDLSEATPPARC